MSRSRLCRCGRFLLASAMVLAWTGMIDFLRQPALGEGPTGVAALQPAQKVDLLKRLLLTLRDSDRDDMRRLDDLDVVVHDAGGDPLKLCQWVSQNTLWVPYKGVLRGPAGVMLDRLGNSMDRAILLASLLKNAGFETRLGHATLPDAMAAEQLAKIKRPTADWHAPSFAPLDKDNAAFDGYLQKYSVDAKWIQSKHAENELAAEQTHEAIIQRTVEQAPAIAALVHAGPSITDSKSDQSALADNWWTEYRAKGGNDAWTALDPNCGDSAGKPPVAATETIARDSNGKFIFPPASVHDVEIRVVVEQWLDGKLQEHVALKSVARPMDLIGERVSIAHIGIDWPDYLDPAKEPDLAGKLRQLAIAPREWVPVLTLSGQTIIQGGINPDGSVDPKPNLDALKNTAASVAKGASKAVDALGGFAAPAEPAKSTGVMTAEWIEYEIHTPGRETRTVRRELFDCVGPAKRSAGVATAPVLSDHQRIGQSFTLLGMNEIALQCCSVPETAVKHLASQSILSNGQLLLDLLQKPPATADDVSNMDGRIVPGATELFAFASLRFGSSPVGSSVYLDQMNILSKHAWLRESAASADGKQSDSPFTLLQAYDIVENNVAVIPSPGNDAAAIRMQQGIADTVVESVLGGNGVHSENASELFAAATASGESWTTITAKDAGKLTAMNLSADVKHRLEDELKAGHTLLLPEKAGAHIAWWSLDPNTGQMLGIGGNGWGAELTEEANLTVNIALKSIVYFACLGAVIAGHNSGDSLGKSVLATGGCALGLAAGGAGIASSGAAAMNFGRAGDVISAVSSLFAFMK